MTCCTSRTGSDSAKLGREVAIKVPPEAVAGDPERLARFEREARVLASLNHPSIAGIHQVEEAEGQHLLVMELAEGEDPLLCRSSMMRPQPQVPLSNSREKRNE